MCRKSYSGLNDAVDDYKWFLVNYEDTPRSKLFNKYQPMMDPLNEQDSQMEQSRAVTATVNSVNIQSNKNSMQLSSVSETDEIDMKYPLMMDRTKDDTMEPASVSSNLA